MKNTTRFNLGSGIFQKGQKVRFRRGDNIFTVISVLKEGYMVKDSTGYSRFAMEYELVTAIA